MQSNDIGVVQALEGDNIAMKLNGHKSALKEFIEKMEHYFVILPTSRFIDHDDDALCHIYLRIVGVRE